MERIACGRGVVWNDLADRVVDSKIPSDLTRLKIML